MTFKELQLEDKSKLEYELLKVSMALHHQLPDEIILIRNKRTAKYIIVKTSTISGLTTTKSIVMPLADSVFFNSWFCNDFPDLPLTIYNSQKGGVADESAKDFR